MIIWWATGGVASNKIFLYGLCAGKIRVLNFLIGDWRDEDIVDALKLSTRLAGKFQPTAWTGHSQIIVSLID